MPEKYWTAKTPHPAKPRPGISVPHKAAPKPGRAAYPGYCFLSLAVLVGNDILDAVPGYLHHCTLVNLNVNHIIFNPYNLAVDAA